MRVYLEIKKREQCKRLSTDPTTKLEPGFGLQAPQSLATTQHCLSKTAEDELSEGRPLAVRLPWLPRGRWAGRTPRPAVSGSSLGARPLSRGRLRANQTRAMPRRARTGPGSQGQGPGHNGAVVGLQEAAVPRPPSLPLHSPAPPPGGDPDQRLLRGPRPEETAFRTRPQAREARPGRRRPPGGDRAPPSRGRGGRRRAASLDRRSGRGLPCPSCLIPKNQVRSRLPSPFPLRSLGSGLSGAFLGERQNGRGRQHFSLKERNTRREPLNSDL